MIRPFFLYLVLGTVCLPSLLYPESSSIFTLAKIIYRAPGTLSFPPSHPSPPSNPSLPSSSSSLYSPTQYPSSIQPFNPLPLSDHPSPLVSPSSIPSSPSTYLILDGSYSDTKIYVPETPRNTEIMIMFIGMTKLTNEGVPSSSSSSSSEDNRDNDDHSSSAPMELTPAHIQAQLQHEQRLQKDTEYLYSYLHTIEGLNQPWNYLFYLQLGYLYMGKHKERSIECNILAYTVGLQAQQYGYAGIGLYNIAKLRKEMGKTESNQYFDTLALRYSNEYNPSLVASDPSFLESPLYFNVSFLPYYRDTPIDDLLETAEQLFLRCNKTKHGWYNAARTLRLQELQHTRQFTKLSTLAETILLTDPYNQRALAELGILSFTLGQRDKALDYWLRALSSSLSRHDTMSMYAIMDAIISQLSIESMQTITIPIRNFSSIETMNMNSNEHNGSENSSPFSTEAPIIDYYPFHRILQDYLRDAEKYAKLFHRILSPKLSLNVSVISTVPSTVQELLEVPLLPIFAIRDIFKRMHTALLVTKAAAVGASFVPSLSSAMEATAFTLIRLCTIVSVLFHPLSSLSHQHTPDTIASLLSSLPYPFNDYSWSRELFTVCSTESWPLHAYWYVHMGRARLPIVMQDSTLIALLNSKVSVRPKGYLLPSSLLLSSQRTILRQRALHAGISSYDFRTHAFGFIVEGLLRHTRSHQLRYSLWFLGPADKSSVSYLNYSRTIYCREDLRYVDTIIGQMVDCTDEPIEGGKALAVIPRILNVSSLQYILSMNASLTVPSTDGSSNTHSQTDTLVSLVPTAFFDVTPDAQGWAVARTMAMMDMDILVDAMGATFGNRVDVIDALHSKATSSIHAVILQNIPSTSSSDDAMTTDRTIVPPESFGTRLSFGSSDSVRNHRLPIVSALLEPRIIYVRHTWLLSDFSRYLVTECRPKVGNNYEYGCLPLPDEKYDDRTGIASNENKDTASNDDVWGKEEQEEKEEDIPYPSNVPIVKLGGLQSFDKLDDQVITIWSNILHGSSNSILVLLNSTNPYATHRIQEELIARGIHPQRIHMLPGAPHAKHIRRLPYVADLILDTSMCNGHTTTADALYSGVPVLTLEGDVLHNRVASSLIQTAANGLHRILVTYTAMTYESLGIRLSRYNEQYYLLRTLRQRILHASLSAESPSVYAPTQADDVYTAHRTLLEVMASASVPKVTIEKQRHPSRDELPSAALTQQAPYGYDCHMIINTKDEYTGTDN